MIEKNKGHSAGSAQVSSEQVKRCYTAFFFVLFKENLFNISSSLQYTHTLEKNLLLLF